MGLWSEILRHRSVRTPCVELLDIACVTTTLATATHFLAGRYSTHSEPPPDASAGTVPGYDVRLLSAGGRPLTARPGLRLEAHGALERDTGPVDTLVVVGGYGHLRAAQAQMSMHVAAPAPANDVVRDVIDHVVAHLDGDLSAAVLAERAGVSERHLVRLFRAHLGRSPAEHVRRARTDAAAALLAATDLPLARVADRCGFGSSETMRQAFLDLYGRTPSEHRRALRVPARAGGHR